MVRDIYAYIILEAASFQALHERASSKSLSDITHTISHRPIQIYALRTLFTKGTEESYWACLVVWIGGPGSYLENLAFGSLVEGMQYPMFGCLYKFSLVHAR
jgi:hypothetical protein